MNKRWLIWSLEHDAWWNPNSMGYTQERSKAGRYDLNEALVIVHNANFRCGNKPNEALVPLDPVTDL
jgi:hypothetical protein